MDNSASEKTLLWHPAVHAKFGERLFYYRVSTIAFFPDYVDTISEKLKENGRVGGLSAYQVYGPHDYLFRLWLNSAAEFEANKLFSGPLVLTPPRSFYVTDSRYWAFRKPLDQKLLDSVTPEVVRKIQEKKNDNELYSKLKDERVYRRERIDDQIKYYIEVSAPAYGTPRAIEYLKRDLEALVESWGESAQGSVYYGEGFAWALLKGVTEEFEKVAPRVVEVNRRIIDFAMRTTTYLCWRQYPQVEHIAEQSLRVYEEARPLVDEDVFGWLPELGLVSDLEQRKALINAAYNFRIIQKDKDTSVSEDDEYMFRNFLIGVAKSELAVATQPLTYWLIGVEGMLRQRWQSLSELVDKRRPNLREQIEDTCGVRGGLDKATFGTLLCLFFRLAERIDFPTEPKIKAVQQALPALRNIVLHGNLSESFLAVREWSDKFNALLSYLRFRKWLEMLSEKLEHGT